MYTRAFHSHLPLHAPHTTVDLPTHEDVLVGWLWAHGQRGQREEGKGWGEAEESMKHAEKSNGCLFSLAVAPDQAEKSPFQPHMLIILALLALPSLHIHSPPSQYLGRKVQIAGRREKAVGGETAWESHPLPEGQVILHWNAGARNFFPLFFLLPSFPLLAALLLAVTPPFSTTPLHYHSYIFHFLLSFRVGVL